MNDVQRAAAIDSVEQALAALPTSDNAPASKDGEVLNPAPRSIPETFAARAKDEVARGSDELARMLDSAANEIAGLRLAVADHKARVFGHIDAHAKLLATGTRVSRNITELVKSLHDEFASAGHG